MGRFKNDKNGGEEKVQLTNVQRLMDIINNRRDAGKRQPYGFSEQPQEFAQQFIKFLELRMKYEIDTLKLLPYQERLSDCMISYYRLNNGDQHYLHNLREKGIWWRGDSIKFMRIREKITPEMMADKSGLMKVMRSMSHGNHPR